MANWHADGDRAIPRNHGREAEFLEGQVGFGRLPSAGWGLAVICDNDAEYEVRGLWIGMKIPVAAGTCGSPASE